MYTRLYLVPKNKEQEFACFPLRRPSTLPMLSLATLNARTFGAMHAFDGAAHVMRFMEDLLLDGLSSTVSEEVLYLLGHTPDEVREAPLYPRVPPTPLADLCCLAHPMVGPNIATLRHRLCGAEREACVASLTAALAFLFTQEEVILTGAAADGRGVKRQVAALEKQHRICYGARKSSACSPFPFAHGSGGGAGKAKAEKQQRADEAQHTLQTCLHTGAWRARPALASKAWPSIVGSPHTEWISGCTLDFGSVSREDAWDAVGDPASIVRLLAVVCLRRLAVERGDDIWDTVPTGSTRLAWLACHATHAQIRALFIKGRVRVYKTLPDSRHYCRHYIWHPLLRGEVGVWVVKSVVRPPLIT